MTYKHWINKNYDRLVSEYEDYLVDFGDIEQAECNERYPMTLGEFILDKWDDFDEYVEREERE